MGTSKDAFCIVRFQTSVGPNGPTSEAVQITMNIQGGFGLIRNCFALMLYPLLLFCAGCTTFKVPAPRRNATPLPPQEISTIAVPVTVSLGAVQSSVTGQLPRTLVKDKKRFDMHVNELVTETVMVPTEIIETVIDKIPIIKHVPLLKDIISGFKNVERKVTRTVMKPVEKLVPHARVASAEIEYEAILQRVDFSFKGNRATAAATVDFLMKVRLLTPIFKTDVASAGIGEQKPSFKLTVSSDVEWGEDASIVFKNQQVQFQWLREAHLTAANVTIDDLLKIPALRDQVNSQLQKAMEKVPKQISIKSQLSSVWKEISETRTLGTNIWFSVRPESLGISDISGDYKEASVLVQVLAKPTVVFGEQPQLALEPLPKLSKPTAPRGIHLQALGELPFDEAERVLNDRISRDEIKYAKGIVRITKAEVYGSENRLVVALKLRKPFRGTIFLVGTPKYTPERNRLSVPDLDYTVETRSLLANAADWLLHEPFQNYLVSKAVFDVGKRIDDFKQKYSNLSTGLGKVGTLTAKLTKVQPRGVFLSRTSVQTLVDFEGDAAVVLKLGK